MRLSRLRRPRYADVVATLALFFALGGTAYAATIGTSDIKDGAVTTRKLHDNAVVSGKVVANALNLGDIKGINITGTISISLPANACGQLNLSVAGAVAGQAGVLTWTGAVPAHVVLGPLKVVDSTHMIVQACNPSANPVDVSGVGVRIVTFG